MEKPGQKVVNCPKCNRYYRLPPQAAGKPGARLRCTGCGNLFSLDPQPAKPAPAGDGPRIVVATDGSEMWGIISEVLSAGGCTARIAGGGEEALQIIEEWSPRAAVLDVSLPGIPVFEICDRLRSHERHSKMGIILLASVYEHTRYKRAPTSLYGADDYIEKHHLRDSLLPKIERLMPREDAPAGTPPAPPAGEREEARPNKEGLLGPEEAREEQEVIVREERFGPVEEGPAPTQGRHESLKRFARIIVSDIALYNQELIEEGVKKGTLQNLLADEFAEGKKLFRTRAPAGIGMEFYDQALEEFIKKQRARFQGGAGA